VSLLLYVFARILGAEERRLKIGLKLGEVVALYT
jgi:hypothetical protein